MFDYSRFRGVSWDNIRKKWYSRITFSGKRYALGRYDTEEEAAEAYKTAQEMGQSEFKAWYNKDPEHRGPLVDKKIRNSDFVEDEDLIKTISFLKDSAEIDKKEFQW